MPSTSPSVIVCTHQRSAALAPCLAHLLQVTEAFGATQIVLVNNASTDDTQAVACSMLDGVPHAQVVDEPRLGLSRARNRGIAESTGDLVVFLDDDAFPHPGWLDSLVPAFDDPTVEAAGGPISPRFDGPLPPWLDQRYLPYLSAWDRGPEAHSLSYNEYPRGANLAFRRTALERVGPFEPRLGRCGTRLASCEEIELCLRIERTGGQVRYVPGARVDHVVPTGRLDVYWMARRFHWQGRSEAVVDWRHGGWRALRAGLGRAKRAWLGARTAGDPLAAAFHRAARIGYTIGLLEAVRVRRFTAANAKSWSTLS